MASSLDKIGHSQKQALKDLNTGKRQFKNNLHHKQQVILYGTEFEKHHSAYDVYGKLLPVPVEPQIQKQVADPSEHYWSEYRRNYEANMRAKMDQDRRRIQLDHHASNHTPLENNPSTHEELPSVNKPLTRHTQ